jgi:hypothetical protein
VTSSSHRPLPGERERERDREREREREREKTPHKIKHKCHLPMRSLGFETAISGSIPLENYIRYDILILRSKNHRKKEKKWRDLKI